MEKRNIIRSLFILGVIFLSSCSESFLDRHPEGPVSNQSGDKFIRARLSSAYAMMYSLNKMTGDDGFGHMAYLHVTELLGQDVVMNKYDYGWFSKEYRFQTRSEASPQMFVPWDLYYKIIKIANEVCYSVQADNADADLLMLRGQALGLRGFAYHMLAQFYAKSYLTDPDAPAVPIYTLLNQDNQPRSSLRRVYVQAENDLLESADLLKTFKRKNKQELDFNIVQGLLARVYLCKGEWEKAVQTAMNARQGKEIMDETAVFDGFLDANNNAWMWAGIITPDNTTDVGSFHGFVSNYSDGGYGPFQQRCILDRLYNQISDTDVRKNWFIDATMSNVPDQVIYPAPYANIKFKIDNNWTEDVPFMRVEEMVLIQAEALAHLNRNAEAAQVLGELMSKRDKSWNQTSITVDDVLLQRRIELWCEGFSFFDLKRLNLPSIRTNSNHKKDAIFNLEPGDKRFIYLIPTLEIQSNEKINANDQNEL